MNTKQIKIRGNIDLNNNSQIGQKHDWLHPIDQNHLNSRADDYFRDVSYYLNLQVIDTCYYNEQMEYVPVLVQIMQEKVKQSFGDAEYLLQVWHSQTKKQIFQIPLKVKYYQVFEDYLVCAYHDMKLVFITVEDSSLFRAKEDIRVDQLPQLTYQCKLPIQALLLLNMQEKVGGDKQEVKKLIIAFETIQNLLDFNFIIINKVETDKLNISFNQARDVFPRPLVSPDPVVQCIIRVMLTKFNNKQKYVVQGVTRRKSGQVDLYSNMMFKQQVPDCKFPILFLSKQYFLSKLE
ncbi:UNKNOWN [Stylonychia lemnae]|uniref:Uncharacterized protein n=1 Tax=Stylonychia lemnae TaxID=5949 RepID=A0A077ZZ88_STYLE|nr:UNKNOWN [Stylonychia lemnae]|eukprot:CDW75266.1 UNKNOWN [Stylonychia lemnae]